MGNQCSGPNKAYLRHLAFPGASHITPSSLHPRHECRQFSRAETFFKCFVFVLVREGPSLSDLNEHARTKEEQVFPVDHYLSSTYKRRKKVDTTRG